MQIIESHKSVYKLNRVTIPEENVSSSVLELKEKIQTWQKLKSYLMPDNEIARIVGISRATYYRYCAQLATYGLKGLEAEIKTTQEA